MESRGILSSVLVHFACTCLIIARMEKKNPYLGFFFFVYRGLVAQGPAGSAVKRIADEAILSDLYYFLWFLELL